MLFNSYEFLFAFLPITLVVFFVCGRVSRDVALGWLIVASLFFYAWWRPLNVLIIAPAIAVNYLLARGLVMLVAAKMNARANALLAIGILFNVAFLGYFKYANFAKTVLNDVAGTSFVLSQIVLPLGISFITFQKIAFLIDVHAQRVEKFSLRDFCLFVLFFPQLIAGPIVHFREVMPQFQKPAQRSKGVDLAVGLSLLAMGLFKKLVLADNIAGRVTPIYDAAAGGDTITFFYAWIAAIGFTLQIYFDFSGYSDMAIGLARCVGIKLPPNFESPLKASSIIDFWLRWHMTLTRFLTAYIFDPLALWFTRRRLAKGLPALTGRRPSLTAFASVLAGPIMLTMFVAGLWHGAGYLFVLFGLLHGVYLVINHAWRRFVVPRLKDRNRYRRMMWPLGWCVTFPAVVVAMVLFRSPTVRASVDVLGGMAGLHGATLPNEIVSHLGFARSMIAGEPGGASDFATSAAWLLALLAIALLLPNSRQLMVRYEPVLLEHPSERHGWNWLSWSPSLPWAVAIGAVAFVAVLNLGGVSEFLYWQF